MAQENIISCNPQPYLILKSEDEVYLDVFDKNGVILSTSYLKCMYVESKPTGFTNLSVPKEYWTKYTPNQLLSAGVESKSAAAMLKDREK